MLTECNEEKPSYLHSPLSFLRFQDSIRGLKFASLTTILLDDRSPLSSSRAASSLGGSVLLSQIGIVGATFYFS